MLLSRWPPLALNPLASLGWLWRGGSIRTMCPTSHPLNTVLHSPSSLNTMRAFLLASTLSLCPLQNGELGKEGSDAATIWVCFFFFLPAKSKALIFLRHRQATKLECTYVVSGSRIAKRMSWEFLLPPRWSRDWVDPPSYSTALAHPGCLVCLASEGRGAICRGAKSAPFPHPHPPPLTLQPLPLPCRFGFLCLGMGPPCRLESYYRLQGRC